jgi:hypothetical protein
MATNCSECLDTIESELGIMDINASCTLKQQHQDEIRDIRMGDTSDEIICCPDCGAVLNNRGNNSYCVCCGWQPIIF